MSLLKKTELLCQSIKKKKKIQTECDGACAGGAPAGPPPAPPVNAAAAANPPNMPPPPHATPRPPKPIAGIGVRAIAPLMVPAIPYGTYTRATTTKKKKKKVKRKSKKK